MDIRPFFPQFLPDLGHIPSLRLHHRYKYTPATQEGWPTNIGLVYLYCSNFTGHEYLVCLPQPHQPPEAWPVALYSEETGASQVVASSIKTWFPAYFTLHVRDLLANYQFKKERGSNTNYVEQDIQALQQDSAAINALCQHFANPAFEAWLPTLWNALAQPEEKIADWVQGYRTAEDNSYLADYEQIKARATQTAQEIEANAGTRNAIPLLENLSLEDWLAYTTRYPHSNKALPYLFSTFFMGKWMVKRAPHLIANVPTDLLLEVFRRPHHLDFDGSGEIGRILPLVAKRLHEEGVAIEPPYAPLVAACQDGLPELSALYVEVGDALASVAPADAVVAYQNALFWAFCEEERFAEEVYAKLLPCTADLGGLFHQAWGGNGRNLG